MLQPQKIIVLSECYVYDPLFNLIFMMSSLIAISGLGGHAFGSFKERGGDHMWLRDALPYDITGEDSNAPILRVMIHGYESSLQNSDSFQNLEDIGTSFHSSLRSLAIAGSFRPIILVAHSLGGLVVKEVCALSIPV
jgi:protein SERAC1